MTTGRIWRSLLLALVLVTATPALAQAIPAPWPGLPAVPGSAQWWGIQGNGLSEAARARQWIKIPAQALAVANYPESTTFPPDDPQHRRSVYKQFPLVFFSSPAGAEHGYGLGLPMTVRTVAFGVVPVEARLQLEQLRDKDDLPVPLRGEYVEERWTTPQFVRPGVTSEVRGSSVRTRGELRIHVVGLAVDGVDLQLGGTCRSGPVSLDVDGDPVWSGDPVSDPYMQSPPLAHTNPGINWMAEHNEGTVGWGGAVSGTVTIPAFSGCRTRSGEDLSRLLTGSLSGPGNHVRVGFTPIDGFRCGSKIPPYMFDGPRKPFAGDPSDCDPDYRPPVFDFPARP